MVSQSSSDSTTRIYVKSVINGRKPVNMKRGTTKGQRTSGRQTKRSRDNDLTKGLDEELSNAAQTKNSDVKRLRADLEIPVGAGLERAPVNQEPSTSSPTQLPTKKEEVLNSIATAPLSGVVSVTTSPATINRISALGLELPIHSPSTPTRLLISPTAPLRSISSPLNIPRPTASVVPHSQPHMHSHVPLSGSIRHPIPPVHMRSPSIAAVHHHNSSVHSFSPSLPTIRPHSVNSFPGGTSSPASAVPTITVNTALHSQSSSTYSPYSPTPELMLLARQQAERNRKMSLIALEHAKTVKTASYPKPLLSSPLLPSSPSLLSHSTPIPRHPASRIHTDTDQDSRSKFMKHNQRHNLLVCLSSVQSLPMRFLRFRRRLLVSEVQHHNNLPFFSIERRIMSFERFRSKRTEPDYAAEPIKQEISQPSVSSQPLAIHDTDTMSLVTQEDVDEESNDDAMPHIDPEPQLPRPIVPAVDTDTDYNESILRATVMERFKALAGVKEYYKTNSHLTPTFRETLCGRNESRFTADAVSPYTGMKLRAFIRRDHGCFPPWTALMKELVGKFSKPAKSLDHSSIDYCYLRPEHVFQVNSLLQTEFWDGIHVGESLIAPDYTVVVLFGRLVIGCGLMSPQGYITYIYVRPEFRSLGISQHILYYLVTACPDRDITLHVSATNSAMLLYNKFGFKVEEYILNFYSSYLPPTSPLSRHAYLLRLRHR